jgi:putative transcriptional regulator
MKKSDFDNLVASIRQAGKIRRGEAAPSRVTKFRAVDVKAIRQRLLPKREPWSRLHAEQGE